MRWELCWGRHQCRRGAGRKGGLTWEGEAERATGPPESGCSVTPTQGWPARGGRLRPGQLSEVPAPRRCRPVEAVICWEQAMGSAAVTRHDGASRREMTGLSVHHACCSTKSERGISSVIKHTTCTSVCFRWRRWWWCWWWGNPNSQWQPENKLHMEEN